MSTGDQWMNGSFGDNLNTGGNTMQPPRQKTGPLPHLKFYPDLIPQDVPLVREREKTSSLIVLPEPRRAPQPPIARMVDHAALLLTLVVALLLSCALGG